MLEWLFGSEKRRRKEDFSLMQLGFNREERLIRLQFAKAADGFMMQPHQAKALGKSLIAAAEILEELDEQNDPDQAG